MFDSLHPLHYRLEDHINWLKFPNVKLHGKFKNPSDLSVIYNKIDLNVICYDTTSINVRIAEPNKLYESIFFNAWFQRNNKKCS